jgi:CHAD domain-containing protein
MRVAIRRFRVALGNFAKCITREDRQRARTKLEHLADALGGVRDLDVMIAAVKRALPNRSDSNRQLLKKTIRRLKSRRRSRLRKLVNYLDGYYFTELKREIQGGSASAEKERQLGQTA